MRSLLGNNRGATAVEFALVALPVIWFIVGIMQTGWIVWTDNLLHIAVDTAARCGAISSSTTYPCFSGDMQRTANAVFQPLSGATFGPNSSCSNDGGAGLVGTYTTGLAVFTITLTAQSCYPVPQVSSS
jgi:Flp pilus assembly protein TadG